MKDKPEVLCIIPARGGSKTLKNKNNLIFNDKPLISWTFIEAKKSACISRIIVSTDNPKTIEISKEYDMEVRKRPNELSLDSTTTADVVIDLLDDLKKENYIPDYILILQCTSPHRKVKHIDESITKLLEKKHEADSLVSVSIPEHHPFLCRTIRENDTLEKFIKYDSLKYARRQAYPKVAIHNGAIFLIETKILCKNKIFETDKTLAYEMDLLYSIDIDTQLDFDIAEYLMKKYEIKTK